DPEVVEAQRRNWGVHGATSCSPAAELRDPSRPGKARPDPGRIRNIGQWRAAGPGPAHRRPDAVGGDGGRAGGGAVGRRRRRRRSPPHAAGPAIGAVSSALFPVTDADTAAAMGHPDPGVRVLATPRLGLWFEVATSPLMPEPATG